jgi:hypothetical protein
MCAVRPPECKLQNCVGPEAVRDNVSGSVENGLRARGEEVSFPETGPLNCGSPLADKRPRLPSIDQVIDRPFPASLDDSYSLARIPCG